MLFKWVGSKRRLVDDILAYIPEEFDHYIEPFFGAGHVGLSVLDRNVVKGKVIFSDKNLDLISFWLGLKETPEKLWDEILHYKSKINKEDYLKIRRSRKTAVTTRGARFFYLIKTGYKGLWRVNSIGDYNTAYMGCNEESFMPDKAQFHELSKLMNDKDVEFQNLDYRECINEALRMKLKGDVVAYLDPPYHDTFSSYTVDKFKNHDHVVLSYLFKKMKKRGWTVIESNSNSDYIKDLYRENTVNEVSIMHNSSPDGARETTELIIRS